ARRPPSSCDGLLSSHARSSCPARRAGPAWRRSSARLLSGRGWRPPASRSTGAFGRVGGDGVVVVLHLVRGPLVGGSGVRALLAVLGREQAGKVGVAGSVGLTLEGLRGTVVAAPHPQVEGIDHLLGGVDVLPQAPVAPEPAHAFEVPFVALPRLVEGLAV